MTTMLYILFRSSIDQWRRFTACSIHRTTSVSRSWRLWYALPTHLLSYVIFFMHISTLKNSFVFCIDFSVHFLDLLL